MGVQVTPADVRERLLALLLVHGVPPRRMHQRALNQCVEYIIEALADAYRAGTIDQQGRQ